MMMYDGGFWFGMHAFWWLFWVIVIVVLVYLLLRAPSDVKQVQRESAHEVLRRRYAAGELTTQEYEERKAVLERDVEQVQHPTRRAR